MEQQPALRCIGERLSLRVLRESTLAYTVALPCCCAASPRAVDVVSGVSGFRSDPMGFQPDLTRTSVLLGIDRFPQLLWNICGFTSCRIFPNLLVCDQRSQSGCATDLTSLIVVLVPAWPSLLKWTALPVRRFRHGGLGRLQVSLLTSTASSFWSQH